MQRARTVGKNTWKGARERGGGSVLEYLLIAEVKATRSTESRDHELEAWQRSETSPFCYHQAACLLRCFGFLLLSPLGLKDRPRASHIGFPETGCAHRWLGTCEGGVAGEKR